MSDIETTSPSMSARPVPVEELSYTEASGELDEIVAFFEQRDIDIDHLVSRLERATAIVDELDRRLRRTRLQVEELVPRLEAAVVERSTPDGEAEDPHAETPPDQGDEGVAATRGAPSGQGRGTRKSGADTPELF